MSRLIRCTLEMMLAARDARRRRQQAHFNAPGAPVLLVATVVAPGEYKLTELTAKVARAEREALRHTFSTSILSCDELDLPTGHETWLALSCTQMEAKRLAVEIEETHQLGRLFDIDIITPALSPISRTGAGLPPRRCLLCDREARECMRAHTHSPQQVSDHIRAMVDNYHP